MLMKKKKVMKILYISVRADYGGGPEHLFQLIKTDDTNESFVAIPSSENDKNQIYWNKIGNCIGFDRLISIPFRKFHLSDLLKLKKIIKKEKINIVHSHGKGAGLYSRLLKILRGNTIKIVHTFHGLHVGEYDILKKSIYLFYEKLFSLLTDRFIHVSESEKKQFSGFGVGFNNKATVIINGTPVIEEQDLCNNKSMILKKYPQLKKRKVVVSITRFDHPKNMWLALEIASLLPEYTFLWIGDGPDKKTLEKKVQNLGLKNIIFTGFHDNPVHLLTGCDVYLSTSLWEGLPLSLLEAMSVGLPVVASDVVGNNDVVKNNTGSLFPLNNPQEACDQIKFWIRNCSPERKKNIMLYHKENFSSDTMCVETRKLFFSLLEHNKKIKNTNE